MTTTIAIVGRANVGKSTLFNCLTRSRDALVVDVPGVTRDRHSGRGEFEGRRFILIDTGGLETEIDDLTHATVSQADVAIEEADILFFLVDAQAGLCAGDSVIADNLRKRQKPIIVIANKIDGCDPNIALLDFYGLGLGEVIGISAAHRRGVTAMLSQVFGSLPATAEPEREDTDRAIRLAVIGRPNVGKSTLLNRLLNDERFITSDIPGTTRDTLTARCTLPTGETIDLIDTAGVRRRGKVTDLIEKFSAIKTLQAIESADVVIMMLSLTEGIVSQEHRLLQYILESGRALVIVFNKTDTIDKATLPDLKEEYAYQLAYVSYARQFFISAKFARHFDVLMKACLKAYHASREPLSTQMLNRILQAAVAAHEPPLHNGRRIKLRYAHLGGRQPPVIVIHGNQVDSLPKDYQRYLENYFHDALKLEGTPLQMVYRKNENPFAGQKNIPTERQQKRRARIIQHRKRSEKKKVSTQRT